MSGKILNMSRRDGALVMTALAALFMLGMTALVTDIGFLYYSQARLQTAVNAGWKAGYDRMLQTVQGRTMPNSDQQILINDHIRDIMQQNGYSTKELESVTMTYKPGFFLKVESTQNVGLFFARVMSFTSSNVSAVRQNHAEDFGQGVVPLAIPNGQVFDLSRSSFAVKYFGENEGFQENTEYILKLGSGGGNIKFMTPQPVDPDDPAPPDPRMIYIPMTDDHLNGQTDENLLRAYGVVYASLRSSAEDTETIQGYWLLGYKGGAFIIHYTEANFARINGFGITHEILETQEEVQKYLDFANPHVFELFAQRKIAVYSNRANSGPAAQTLTDAGIPFTTINDAAIQGGALANYHLVFMEPEDFTGYSGGCSHIGKPCNEFFLSGALGAIAKLSERTKTYLFMCTECQAHYSLENNKFDATAGDDCSLKKIRCCQRVSGSNKEKIWGATKTTGGSINLVNPGLICGTSTATLCYDFIMKSNALNESAPFAIEPFAIQKQKWAVASLIREHVLAGGYIFGQSFAAETFYMAL